MVHYVKSFRPFGFDTLSSKEELTITTLQCECGGFLSSYRPSSNAMLDIIVGPPPKHRKKRILKKLIKRYKERRQQVQLIRPLRPLSYVCNDCGRRDSFYTAVGHNMIQIQPMSKGTESDE